MIINNIANIINQTIKELYSQGIHFYQVILGLIILNIIIYFICKFIKTMQYRN